MIKFTFWPGSDRNRRIDFGNAFGGRGTEYMFAGALAIVIIGALVMTFVYSTKSPTREAAKPMYRCNKCGYEFEKAPDVTERSGRREEFDNVEIRLLDCPKCGAKESCEPMTLCPKCGRYYVSPALPWLIEYRAGGRPKGKRPKDICPYCKTDRMAYIREHRKK